MLAYCSYGQQWCADVDGSVSVSEFTQVVVVQDNLTPGLRRYSAALQARMMGTIEKGCQGLQNKATETLKWKSSPTAPGGRATGRLADSYRNVVAGSPTRIEGTVFTNVDYAGYVEDAPGWRYHPLTRHFVPFDKAPGLQAWVQNHVMATYQTRLAASGRIYTRKHKTDDASRFKGWMVGGPNSTAPHLAPALKDFAPIVFRQLGEDMRTVA